MNLRDLQYLVTVADTLHFGEAAKRCHVSQPTLSMQLKKLEDTLGVQLFERSNKRVLITFVGSDIVHRARVILAEVEQLKQTAHSSRDPFSGILQIGLFPTLAPYLLPSLMPKLFAAFPRLNVLLVEEKTPTLIRQLEEGAIDVALLALPIYSDALSGTPLFEEPFLVAVSPNHALAKHKSVAPDDLLQETLLLLEDGHCLRDQALAFCHMLGVGEANDYRATSLETLRHMVTSSNAVTLMPKLATLHDKTARYIPFSESAPSRRIGLIWRKASARTILFDAMVKLISDAYRVM